MGKHADAAPVAGASGSHGDAVAGSRRRPLWVGVAGLLVAGGVAGSVFAANSVGRSDAVLFPNTPGETTAADVVTVHPSPRSIVVDRAPVGSVPLENWASECTS